MRSIVGKARRFAESPAQARQLGKFLGGGALTVATDYLVFTILVLFNAPLFVASTASFLAGFAVSFTVNKLWVFEARKDTQQHRTQLQMALYVVLLLFNIAFTYYFILVASKLGLSVFLGKVCTIVLITAWNFVLYKKVIFRLKG